MIFASISSVVLVYCITQQLGSGSRPATHFISKQGQSNIFNRDNQIFLVWSRIITAVRCAVRCGGVRTSEAQYWRVEEVFTGHVLDTPLHGDTWTRDTCALTHIISTHSVSVTCGYEKEVGRDWVLGGCEQFLRGIDSVLWLLRFNQLVYWLWFSIWLWPSVPCVQCCECLSD